MTEYEFDNYKFSVNTQVRVIDDGRDEHWDKIVEVDFENKRIGINRGQIYKFNEIFEIIN